MEQNNGEARTRVRADADLRDEAKDEHDHEQHHRVRHDRDDGAHAHDGADDEDCTTNAHTMRTARQTHAREDSGLAGELMRRRARPREGRARRQPVRSLRG